MELFQCFKCGNNFSEPVLKISHDSPQKLLFIQCPVCGGVVGVQEEHSQNSKKNSERTDQEKDLVESSWKIQGITLPDINTVLKHLYG
jgi:DNA-directed RNA polymerase subunit RPC12/RpoP